MTTKTKISDSEISIRFQGEQSAVVPRFSPLESLRFTQDSEGNLFFVSDTYLLLNAERLRLILGEDTYSAILRTIGQAAQSRTPYIQGLSDKDMLDTLKSRYIQSPAEVRAYQVDMLTRGEALGRSYKNYVESVQASLKSQSNPDPAPASSNSQTE